MAINKTQQTAAETSELRKEVVKNIRNTYADPDHESGKVGDTPASNRNVDMADFFSADEFSAEGLSLADFLAPPVDLSVSSGRVSEVASKFKEYLIEASERNSVLRNIGVIELNSQEQVYPAIVIYHKVESPTNGVSLVSYSVLIVESDTELNPLTETGRDGRPIEITIVPFDTYDELYDDEVRRAIVAQLKGVSPETNMHWAGVSVLPIEMKVNEDTDLRGILSEVTKQATSGIYKDTLQANQASMSLGQVLVDNKYELHASLSMKPVISDLTGLPVHADAVISTKAAMPHQQRSRSINQQYRSGAKRNSFALSDVAVSMDLIYVEPNTQPIYGRRDELLSNRRRQEAEPHYLGNVIISDISSGINSNMPLGSVLLAISSVVITHADEVYPELLKPSTDSTRVELGDFGAVGYDIPNADGDVGYIDVTSAEFTEGGSEAFYRLVYEEVSPNLMLSIDIPEAQLGSRAVKALEDTATSGNKNQAINLVIDTANELTNGKFDFYANQIGYNYAEVLSSNALLVPMGYWIDPQNNRRDIREIDYLAVRKWSGENNAQQVLEQWERASALGGDQYLNAAERIEIIKRIVGTNNVFVKGYAWRYLINSQFITALSEATIEIGIAPSFHNLSQREQRRLRGNYADYNNYTLSRSEAHSYASSTRYRRNDFGGNRGGLRRDANYR